MFRLTKPDIVKFIVVGFLVGLVLVISILSIKTIAEYDRPTTNEDWEHALAEKR